MSGKNKFLVHLSPRAQNLTFRGSDASRTIDPPRKKLENTAFDIECKLVEAMRSFLQNYFEDQSLMEALYEIKHSKLASISSRLTSGEPYVYRDDLKYPMTMVIRFINNRQSIIIEIIRNNLSSKSGIKNKTVTLTSNSKVDGSNELDAYLVEIIADLENWYSKL